MIYYLATDKKTIFHYGSYDPETQTVSTGQPFYMEFNTEQELIDILLKYNVTYENNTEL